MGSWEYGLRLREQIWAGYPDVESKKRKDSNEIAEGTYEG